MSLDFYLEYDKKGYIEQIKKAPDDWRFPVREDLNITHNLTKMANAVNRYFYLALWHPERLNIRPSGEVYARDLIDHLVDGLTELREYPEKYKKYNPENGWGSYESLVTFTENVLSACREHPGALVVTCT